MKNMLKVLVIAFTALTVGGVGIAQEKKAEKTEKSATPMDQKMEGKSTKAKTTTATGEVTAVDPKSGQLTVKVKDKDINLAAESKSAKSALEKVKVGEMVRVSYTEKDGKLVATSVKPAPKSTTKTEEKKADMEKKADKK